MDSNEALAGRFEEHRGHLRAVAYRMLGSAGEAEDAVQEAWLRASAAGTGGVENLGGWLTTIVSRVCLNLLRSRATRREVALESHIPDPVVARVDDTDPEQQAILGEGIGLAMMRVLDTLSPAERLAFVLHDVFAVPFDDIADIAEATPTAVRQLASRARKRVQTGAPHPDADPARQRAAVDAFFAAARAGDFARLVAILDPDVVLRSDGGLARAGATLVIRGGESLASQAIMFAEGAPYAAPALINGAAGVVVARAGRVLSVMAFTVVDGRISEIDVLADPERLAALGLSKW